MDELQKKIIQHASVYASQVEKLSGEAHADRVTEIVNDASKKNPETDVGKSVRDSAFNSPIESPYSDNKYDYDTLRDETTTKALKGAFAIIGKHKGLAYPAKSTDESNRELEEALDKCSLDLFATLNQNNVPLKDYEYFFGSLRSIIGALEQYVMQQVGGHRAEMISILCDVKNPGNGKLDQGHATYKQLVDSLLELRKSKKINPEDYFTKE